MPAMTAFDPASQAPAGRVLVAMDDDPVSYDALKTAARLFPAPSHEFLLVNVAHLAMPFRSSEFGFGSVAPLSSDELDAVSGMAVEDIIAAGRAAGVPDPAVVAEAGDPAERIVAAAQEHDVDVIVVGSHSRGLVSRLMSGSVSEAVARHADRPVLVVGRDRSVAAQPRQEDKDVDVDVEPSREL